jgi:hypothetical protein
MGSGDGRERAGCGDEGRRRGGGARVLGMEEGIKYKAGWGGPLHIVELGF